jgi:hypothetical protein
MLPRLPCVVRIAYRLAETGGFDNLGAIKRELAVLGLSGEMQPLAVPSIRDVLEGILFCSGSSSVHLTDSNCSIAETSATGGARRKRTDSRTPSAE